MSRSQKTFMEQFSAAMSRAYLYDRCRELTRVLPLANTSKELSVAFVQICADIFGYAAGGNPGFGWNLTSLVRNPSSGQALFRTGDRNVYLPFSEHMTSPHDVVVQYSSPYDYVTVFSFLASNGPMMDLIHKLLPDPSNVYEYPVTQLPSNVTSGNSPYGGQMGGAVLVSSFEYFFYHFFNLPIRVQLANIGVSVTSTNSDTVYPLLLEDYLAHLLPIDPLRQSKLFSQDIHSNQTSTTLHTSPSPTSSHTRPSLFRKDFSSLHDATLTTTTSSASSNVSNARQTWRLDTIVKIIAKFWLEPFAYESSKNFQKDQPNNLMSPTNNDSLVTASLKVAASLPSIDLMRYTRMFVKHAHYFSNSCKSGAGTLYLPQSLKIQILGDHINVDVMFHFFRHSIAHWPLDASFKFLLETWLSYIQPWRYVQTANGQLCDENSVASIDEPDKWIPFLRENFKFFNNLFAQVLLRFLKQDLATSKNAYMIYRIFKVFSQDNLMPILQNVSNVLIGSSTQKSNFGSPVHKQGNFSAILPHRVSSWDPMTVETEFSNIFSGEFRNFISDILIKIVESKLSERQSLSRRKEEIAAKALKETKEDLMTRLFSMLAGSDGRNTSSVDADVAEREKLLQNLDFCVNKMAEMFNLRQIVEEIEDNFLEEEKKDQERNQSGRDELELTNVDGLYGGLSPHQRLDLLNRKIKPDGRYVGNPDLIPIRTDEFGFLVRLLHKISSNINDRYGDRINDVYQRRSPAGAICRQVCAPPATYLEKADHGRRVQRLPARVVLRPIASFRFIFYTGLAFFISSIVFGKSILATLLYLFFAFVIFVCSNAFVFHPIQPEAEDTLAGESFHETELFR